MITTKVEWDKAHKKTAKIVIGSSEVIEKDEHGNALRKHTLTSLFDQETLLHPSKSPAGQPCPPAQDFLPQAPRPPQPAVPGVAQHKTVEVDAYQFEQLLATLKTHATDKNVRESTKLTLMEVHERLLAIKA